MAATILTLENEHIALTLNDDFSARLTDKDRGCTWRMSECCYQEHGALSEEACWNRRERCYMDRYPSYFRATKRDDGRVGVEILDPLGEVRGELVVAVTLDGAWLKLSIDEIDERLPSLIFPPYIESESLVMPQQLGWWHRKPIPESFFVMPASGWNMRFFGGLRGDNGWVTIVEDGYYDSGVYLSQFTACAAWQKTLDKWTTPRSLRIGFTGGGYVGIAKTFRAYAQSHNLFKSLREKIDEVPSVANLIGGRCIQFFQGYTYHKEATQHWMAPLPPDADEREGKVVVEIPHRDVLTIINEAKAAGMKKGYFNIRGWLNGGYDERHPDVWPPEPALGTIDELKQIMAEQDPFVALLHDNYQDIYRQSPSFPTYVQRSSDGRLKAGGTWHGGRCYMVNSEKSLEYVARNWEQLKVLNPRGTFLDTISGAHFQEDYSTEHPMTRQLDGESKLRITRFYRDKGCIVGSEYGSDFSITSVDFVENRNVRVPGRSIPLWPLVYHDATITLRYNEGTSDTEAAGDIEDILWGHAKMWPAGNLASFRGRIDQFKESLRVDELHARIGMDEMTNHRYLNDDGTIEQTEFSSGVSVVANFSDEEISVGSRAIAPNGYAILD